MHRVAAVAASYNSARASARTSEGIVVRDDYRAARCEILRANGRDKPMPATIGPNEMLIARQCLSLRRRSRIRTPLRGAQSGAMMILEEDREKTWRTESSVFRRRVTRCGMKFH